MSFFFLARRGVRNANGFLASTRKVSRLLSTGLELNASRFVGRGGQNCCSVALVVEWGRFFWGRRGGAFRPIASARQTHAGRMKTARKILLKLPSPGFWVTAPALLWPHFQFFILAPLGVGLQLDVVALCVLSRRYACEGFRGSGYDSLSSRAIRSSPGGRNSLPFFLATRV